ncbi:hypothetical protein AGLY_016870 [Aphis glycines]|uniref:Uncharacterized protein n=1 Tax=Aphis glycines TaxID=307491 RepID=A0A6G0SYJ8_APHGL|nr:hypothetical protein AGLY_016870 [Aphis glycines]
MTVTGKRVLGQLPELLIRLLIDDSQRSPVTSTQDVCQVRDRVFTVHGQVYRRISNDVVRNELMQPKYCELYFIESESANQMRMAQQPRTSPLLENLLTEWDSLLRQINPFAVPFEPDLVARMFHAKLKALMHDITVNRVFGNIAAYEDSKLLTADDVDNVLFAYLPELATERQQFDRVKSHMVHGPCGQLNRNSPCMLDNSCSKKYPKEYSEETVYVSDSGYPTYRRPNNELVANVRGPPVGNEFVVPYNPYLLVKYDAHINVEVCSTVAT